MIWLEKFLFRRVEVWVVALLVLSGLIAAILFAYVARQADSKHRYGLPGRVAVTISDLPKSIPGAVQELLEGQHAALAASQQRFDGQAGFDFHYAAGTRPESGYLLLSRYNGDERRSVVELVDLNSQTTLHVWRPDFTQQNALAKVSSALTVVARDNAPHRARIFHPFLTEAGDIVFQNMSPLVEFDACDRLVWGLDGIFHHSVEAHPDGGYWVAAFLEPQTIGGVSEHFKEGALVHVSADGKKLSERSLPQILIDNGLGAFVYGQDFYSDDPLHLNDIQYAPMESDYWQKGDVFLSLRNVSAIVLYRPSTNKVVWYKRGPWVNQHDVDVLDDHRIVVFNNSRYNMRYGPKVSDANDVLIYDFATDEVTAPFHDLLKQMEMRTFSEGRSEILPDGSLFVEESNYGRLAQIDADGNVLWTYVNRDAEGIVSIVSWSRYVPRDHGDRITERLAKVTCSALGE
ncbi:MAG: arylsulfotransferase family protein [Marinibacterium sp.]